MGASSSNRLVVAAVAMVTLVAAGYLLVAYVLPAQRPLRVDFVRELPYDVRVSLDVMDREGVRV